VLEFRKPCKCANVYLQTPHFPPAEHYLHALQVVHARHVEDPVHVAAWTVPTAIVTDTVKMKSVIFSIGERVSSTEVDYQTKLL